MSKTAPVGRRQADRRAGRDTARSGPVSQPEVMALVCRLWRGIATNENAPRYETIVREQVIADIEAREMPGFLHIDLARRSVPEGVEFLTIMWFDGLDAVTRFVGADHEAAHVPTEARAVLLSFDPRAARFDVVERRPQHYRGAQALASCPDEHGVMRSFAVSPPTALCSCCSRSMRAGARRSRR